MSIVWLEEAPKEQIVPPQATISTGAIVLNKAATAMLGKADSVIIGYDAEAGTIAIAPNTVVRGKAAIKHSVRSTKNGTSISCRKTMPGMLAELGIVLEDRKRLKYPVEVSEEKMVLIKTK